MDSIGLSDTAQRSAPQTDPTHASVVAPTSGRLPSGVLELSSLLQTTLELEVQIDLFGKELQRTFAIDGLRYLSPNGESQIGFGRQATHRATYDLALEEQSLGALSVYREKAFSTEHITALENLLCAVVYPLRNALTYRRAVEMASRDPLTGLNNRRSFDQGFSREMDLANRQATPLALLVVDIDHFKQFNDRHGHDFGDDVLVAVAQAISNTARRSDLVYRYGGEEFVILASYTDSDGGTLLAERIRENIAALRSVRGRETDITVSVGIACMQHGDSETTLFKRADDALYTAKRGGRNRSELAA